VLASPEFKPCPSESSRNDLIVRHIINKTKRYVKITITVTLRRRCTSVGWSLYFGMLETTDFSSSTLFLTCCCPL
jgi:hypothetical protein